MTIEVPPVRKELIVNAAPERAFRIFTDSMDRWWPREHHIGQSPMKKIIVEPGVGGRWYSISEDGSECDIGKVLAWEPPRRLVLGWQITAEWKFDPAFVTEVELGFTAEGPKSTRVAFEHRNLERYAEAAIALRKQLDDPGGWNGGLERYARTIAMKAVVLYESAPDVMAKAPLHFPAHKVRLDAFQARGDLLAVGTFADPREGSMSVFLTREAADEFVREDPFVLNGVVSRVTIKDWNEVLLG
jgi:uncharacterized protein YciI/uncharacterized protein YndB with AHSA1/START domain